MKFISLVSGKLKSVVVNALDVVYDNLSSGLTATNVQDAINEVNETVNTSASPGFSFGRSGNLSDRTYLECEGVPSNVSGRYVYINNAFVSRVFVAVQLPKTFDVRVYHHDGNSVNLTILGTVSVVNSTGGEFSVNWPVPSQKQLCMQILNGSAKNMVGGLELQGTN